MKRKSYFHDLLYLITFDLEEIAIAERDDRNKTIKIGCAGVAG